MSGTISVESEIARQDKKNLIFQDNTEKSGSTLERGRNTWAGYEEQIENYY